MDFLPAKVIQTVKGGTVWLVCLSHTPVVHVASYSGGSLRNGTHLWVFISWKYIYGAILLCGIASNTPTSVICCACSIVWALRSHLHLSATSSQSHHKVHVGIPKVSQRSCWYRDTYTHFYDFWFSLPYWLCDGTPVWKETMFRLSNVNPYACQKKTQRKEDGRNLTRMEKNEICPIENSQISTLSWVAQHNPVLQAWRPNAAFAEGVSKITTCSTSFISAIIPLKAVSHLIYNVWGVNRFWTVS